MKPLSDWTCTGSGIMNFKTYKSELKEILDEIKTFFLEIVDAFMEICPIAINGLILIFVAFICFLVGVGLASMLPWGSGCVLGFGSVIGACAFISVLPFIKRIAIRIIDIFDRFTRW